MDGPRASPTCGPSPGRGPRAHPGKSCSIAPHDLSLRRAGPNPGGGGPSRCRILTALNVVDATGLLVTLIYAGACLAARRARGAAAAIAHVVMLGVCAALMLHVLPGFHNPRIIDSVVLGPGAEPYTKYLNVDKLVAGLFLFAIYAPELLARDEGRRHLGAFAWRFAVLVAAVIPLALALGFVRWDPKWPSWFPWWAAVLLVFTVMPEEALFRGVVQTWLHRRFEGWRGAAVYPVAIAGVLFGIAHLAGGLSYVLLASVAGIGYGWIYAATRSISLAIAAHAGLDVIHFLLFTYPALALHR